jgi:hypothetical protein
MGKEEPFAGDLNIRGPKNIPSTNDMFPVQ